MQDRKRMEMQSCKCGAAPPSHMPGICRLLPLHQPQGKPQHAGMNRRTLDSPPDACRNKGFVKENDYQTYEQNNQMHFKNKIYFRVLLWSLSATTLISPQSLVSRESSRDLRTHQIQRGSSCICLWISFL